MKESQLDVIPLSDIDESDLAVLKEFLYAGRTNSLNPKNVVNLIYLANKVCESADYSVNPLIINFILLMRVF